ncbi:NDP-sugar synthase [bacterium]|nr:NDP-sugar synthase [bacterium]
MDAIVLVGGQGTRLRPLTDRRHKSLAPLCNRPAIEYLLEWLARSGFGRVVFSLGVHNEDLAAAYPAGEHCGIEVGIVQESERLESGGAIRYLRWRCTKSMTRRCSALR